MDEHYFSREPTSAHAPRAFTASYAGRTLRFETDAGVFSKTHMDKGTAMLLDALPEHFAKRVLDLGCGWGAVGVCLAARWPQAEIVMTDVNERATALAKKNLAANGLHGAVFTGDGLGHLEGVFDLIATNPPIRAGKAVIYRLFEESAARLTAGGTLYIVIRKQQGAESARAFLEGLGCHVETVSRGGGGFRVFKAIKGVQ